jgi:hypothetical protein
MMSGVEGTNGDAREGDATMATETIRDIEDLRAAQAERIAVKIKRVGPIDWRTARFAMWDGYPDTRDGQSDNRAILGLIAEGKLIRIEQPDGSSLIGIPV